MDRRQTSNDGKQDFSNVTVGAKSILTSANDRPKSFYENAVIGLATDIGYLRELPADDRLLILIERLRVMMSMWTSYDASSRDVNILPEVKESELAISNWLTYLRNDIGSSMVLKTELRNLDGKKQRLVLGNMSKNKPNSIRRDSGSATNSGNSGESEESGDESGESDDESDGEIGGVEPFEDNNPVVPINTSNVNTVVDSSSVGDLVTVGSGRHLRDIRVSKGSDKGSGKSSDKDSNKDSGKGKQELVQETQETQEGHKETGTVEDESDVDSNEPSEDMTDLSGSDDDYLDDDLRQATNDTAKQDTLEYEATSDAFVPLDICDSYGTGMTNKPQVESISDTLSDALSDLLTGTSQVSTE